MAQFIDPFPGLLTDGILTREELISALRIAVAAEEEAIHLYRIIAEHTTEKIIQEVMRDVAREEQVHVGEFQQLLDMFDPEEASALEEGRQEVREMSDVKAFIKKYNEKKAQGMGRQPGGTGQGPGGKCLCPQCNVTVPHQTGVPCYETECPECGQTMVREAVVASYMTKQGLYWSAPERTYRPTKKEMEPDDTPPVGKPGPYYCPKCKTQLQKKNYDHGQRTYVCKKCLWMMGEDRLNEIIEGMKEPEELPEEGDYSEESLQDMNPEVTTKKNTETFTCPECGSKVLKNTGYCVSCKKKVTAPKK